MLLTILEEKFVLFFMINNHSEILFSLKVFQWKVKHINIYCY